MSATGRTGEWARNPGPRQPTDAQNLWGHSAGAASRSRGPVTPHAAHAAELSRREPGFPVEPSPLQRRRRPARLPLVQPGPHLQGPWGTQVRAALRAGSSQATDGWAGAQGSRGRFPAPGHVITGLGPQPRRPKGPSSCLPCRSILIALGAAGPQGPGSPTASASLCPLCGLIWFRVRASLFTGQLLSSAPSCQWGELLAQWVPFLTRGRVPVPGGEQACTARPWDSVGPASVSTHPGISLDLPLGTHLGGWDHRWEHRGWVPPFRAWK